MSFNLILLFFGTVIVQIKTEQIVGQSDYSNAINKTNVYLEKAANDLNIPGLVAGISINGTQVWAHAVGHTDIENDVVTRVDSVWRIASISKTLTTAMIGKLIDQGKVDLNRPISTYLKPDVFPVQMWNNRTVNITLGQVMSHTAGLHVMDFPNDLYKRIEITNITDGLKPFKDYPLIHEPGTTFNYSNFGFQVVGAVIESVLNQSFETTLNSMFRDLGMNSTFCERREEIIPHRARYYIKTTDANNKTKLINAMIGDDLVSYEKYWPAGGIVSTIPDLLQFGSHMSKWSKGLTTSKTVNLSKETIKKLWTPVSDLNKMGVKTLQFNVTYAHGWFIGTFDTPIVCARCKFSPIKNLIYHTGGISGVATILAIEPQNDIVVASFMNRDPDLHFFDIFQIILKNFVQ